MHHVGYLYEDYHYAGSLEHKKSLGYSQRNLAQVQIRHCDCHSTTNIWCYVSVTLYKAVVTM
jgi:hypothetical protein